MEIYPGGPALVELYGQVDRVGKWESHLPGDGSGKQLLLTNTKPAKEPVLWAGRSHDTPSQDRKWSGEMQKEMKPELRKITWQSRICKPALSGRVVSNALNNSKASYSRTGPAIADRLFERSRRLQLTALEQLSESDGVS